MNSNVGEERTVKVPIMTDFRIPEFEEIDRTDLIVGIGEFYGRDGYYPRTDLGRWYIDAGDVSFNVFLESDGSLNVGGRDKGSRQIWDAIGPYIENEAKDLYRKIIHSKYEPLFKKYGFDSFHDAVKLCVAHSGVKEWLESKWNRGDVISWEDKRGMHSQVGNLGMFVHTWEVDDSYNCRVDYYLDFPGERFISNNFGGSQDEEEIEKYGYKVRYGESHYLNSESERTALIKKLHEKFVSGVVVG